ncbi:MAG: aminoacyl-tRNA hydrolase [Acidobacteriia bacterium]|nr:aminoacyl-tRNA hydrolase [Terriglobia bacterium]
MKLIVGLGNPGVRYQRTRHNAGYMVIDELAREARTGAWHTQCQSLLCTAAIAAQQVLLAKPVTFMNASGRAVQLLLDEYRIDPRELILILDDFNLPLGRVRIRERGSSGGHNGMESVICTLNRDEVIRVRLGIGEENMPEEKAEFVLSDFPPGEAAQVSEMIGRAAGAVRLIVTDGASRAMSVFNA